MQRHTPGELAFVIREQEAALGRLIASWKFGKLFIEILKAKTEAERFGVLKKKLTSLRDLFGRLRPRNRQPRDGMSYPMSMPPFTFST
jgi:hypothetical protein